MSYIKYKTPDKLKEKLKRALTDISKTNDSKIRKGMNEVTKSIERTNAKLVVMAEDVTPPEILIHVPILCEEKGVAYGYLSSKKELGEAVGINVPSSAIAIEKPGSRNEEAFEDLIKQIKNVK